MTTTTFKKPSAEASQVTVVKKHNLLVRVTHWLNIPILLGVGLSGMSIYWAGPVYTHAANAVTGNNDYMVDIGDWICRHMFFARQYGTPDDWVYNHFGLGTGELSDALNLHWIFAYLFMLNGVFYVVGLGLGKGYKSLLPRRTDVGETFAMVRYYLGLIPAKLLRKPWRHPVINSKYNALQRSAYFAMPICGTLSVLSGWAMHKPIQLALLAALFGGYHYARLWHFWLMWIFALFVIPHVILVIADGWDTFRSMIVGWSVRVRHNEGH
jgi:thiosulfate reductase cytochrome b subunit